MSTSNEKIASRKSSTSDNDEDVDNVIVDDRTTVVNTTDDADDLDDVSTASPVKKAKSSENLFEKACVINIGVIKKTSQFEYCLNELLEEVKIYSKFRLKTTMIDDIEDEDDGNRVLLSNLNYVIYVITDKIFDDSSSAISSIKKVASQLNRKRQHMLVVLDTTVSTTLNDDDELVFDDDDDEKAFRKIRKEMSEDITIVRLNSKLANVWNSIADNESMSELSERQVDYLASLHVKKASKMSFADKKREMKVLLKKIEVDEEQEKTGYTMFEKIMNKYFKIINQKSVVCQNYLELVANTPYDGATVLIDLLNVISNISFIKDQQLTAFTDGVSELLLHKLRSYYEKNRVVINMNQSSFLNSNSQLEYLKTIRKAFAVSHTDLTTFIDKEISAITKAIQSQCCKEIESITDLNKISSYLESYTGDLELFFSNIPKQSKIIQENLCHTDRWLSFLKKADKLGVSKDLQIKLIEEVIYAKINFCMSVTRGSKTGVSPIYPHCLNIFLHENLQRSFVFKRILMFLNYTIRYSGKDLSTMIKDMTENEYVESLALETALVLMFKA